MSNIHIKGDFSQKTEIFGKVLSHHTGNFDFTKTLGDSSWSQHLNVGTITESVTNGIVTVTLSAFGHSVQLFKTGTQGHNNFKIELDSGNFVQGTATVS
jgi:hypothetical protein